MSPKLPQYFPPSGRERGRERGRPPAVHVVIADLHLNSTIALFPPGFRRDDGELIIPNQYHDALWQAWLDFWSSVAFLVAQHNAELYVTVNGDVFEGYHHGSTQVMTHNPAGMLTVGYMVLQPIAKRCRRFCIVRGTPSHAGASAFWEETLARWLNATPDRETGSSTWWHLPITIRGVRFSIAHHRRQNTLPWTMGGAPNRLAAETVYEYARSGDPRPHVVLRSHGHMFDESSRRHPVKVIFTPCWQLKTEFSHKIAPDRMPDIGGLIFLCQDGDYEWEPLIYPAKRPAPVVDN